MTAIPTGTKFVGISASVPTKERRSALSNGYQDTYTVDDIVSNGQINIEVTNYYSQQAVTSGDLIVGATYEITGYHGAGVQTFASLDGGSGYSSSLGVATTTDGSGVGLTLNTTAVGGIINNVVVANPGYGYAPGDTIFISGGNDDAQAVVDIVLPSDDFTNVGATANANGQTFVATGTTPTEWGGSSELTLQAGDVVTTETATVSSLQPLKRVVNISSAQILAMGSTPIELLPAPGANKYYDIEKIILEPTEGLTPYTNNEDIYVTDGSTVGYTNRYALGTQPSIIRNFSQFVRTESYWGGDVVVSDQLQINQPITMTTDGGTNPTLGDGTLRAIITYTVITFGS